jgi:origin recognition complex subunit 3
VGHQVLPQVSQQANNGDSAWYDRIPTVLLFGIATSIEVFQERLPQAAISRLGAKQFNALQSQELLERIFSSTITGTGIPVRIGPQLAKAILKRPKEQIQSPHEFIDAFQVRTFYSGWRLT